MTRKAGLLIIGALLAVIGIVSWAVRSTRTPPAVADRGIDIGRFPVVPPAHEEAPGPRIVATETPSPAPEHGTQSPKDSADAQVQVQETESQAKRRALQSLLDQFDGKVLEQPDWPGLSRQELAPVLVMMSVAAIMDAEGTSIPTIADGKRRDPFSGGRYDCSFFYNSRDYQFIRGQFPIYDEYKELALAAAARRRTAEAERAESASPLQGPAPSQTFPEEFLNRASLFGHGVLALWQ